MKQVRYSQRLRGRLTVVGPGLADVHLSAGEATPLGSATTLASQLAFTTERSFREEGTIAVDGEDALRFTTLGHGDLSDSPDPGLRHGTAVLEVEGMGVLAGTRGRITSNFLVLEDGELTDEQAVVLFVEEGEGP